MDLRFVEGLLDLVGRAPVAELELSRDGWRIRIVKAGQAAAEAPPPPARAGTAAPESAAPTQPSSVGRHVVAAGLAGIFYRAPAPGEPPFIAEGDAVEEGRTLALIEAMKTLIKVEADRAGRVAEILAEDGAAVAAGDPLFAIEPGEGS